jgi:large subunit ribosomal protein L1
MPRKRSKRYNTAWDTLPETKVPLVDAVKMLKSFPAAKFDQTVELHLHLGIDPRQADQALRGSFSLPHGVGKQRKVIAFCEGEEAEQAKEAGAIEAGGEELVAKIQEGWTDFDVAIAKPQMMKLVSRLGRVLGPQGKMPSPKAGTVVQDDIAEAVGEFAAGKVEYRNDAGGNLHVAVGKLSFDEQQLIDNVDAFLALIRRLRPTSVRGTYIKRVCLAATMTPSVDVDVLAQRERVEEEREAEEAEAEAQEAEVTQ